MENIELTYATLNASHAKGLCELYRVVFNKRVDENYFITKYGLSDPERFQCATVAFDQGQLIGFYGCFSIEFCDFTRNRCEKAVNVCDFILLKKYRGRGILDLLYAHSLALIEEEKIAYLFGFQSEQTYKFSKRMGWEDHRQFVRFHVPLTASILAKGLRKINSNWVRKRIEKAIEKWRVELDLDALNRVPEKWTVKYDHSFLQLKEFCPHYGIEIKGVKWWLKFDRIITVGLVHFKDERDLEIATMELQKALRFTGVEELVIHVHEKSRQAEAFSGFLDGAPSFKISYLRLRETEIQTTNHVLNHMDMDIF